MAARGEACMPLTPAAPPAGRPTEPAVMGRSEPPKVLEMVILILGAPTDMWRVWRSVASRITLPELKGAGGMLLASTNCGMLVQVLIQCSPSCLFSTASIARPLTVGEITESAANATERSDV